MRRKDAKRVSNDKMSFRCHHHQQQHRRRRHYRHHHRHPHRHHHHRCRHCSRRRRCNHCYHQWLHHCPLSNSIFCTIVSRTPFSFMSSFIFILLFQSKFILFVLFRPFDIDCLPLSIFFFLSMLFDLCPAF